MLITLTSLSASWSSPTVALPAARGPSSTQLSRRSASAIRTSWSSTSPTWMATRFASACPRRSRPTCRAPTL
eukprot:2491578-Prymnesium_polylepis.1